MRLYKPTDNQILYSYKAILHRIWNPPICFLQQKEFIRLTNMNYYRGYAYSREHKCITIRKSISLPINKIRLWSGLGHILFEDKPQWWVSAFASKMSGDEVIYYYGKYDFHYGSDCLRHANTVSNSIPDAAALTTLARKAAIDLGGIEPSQPKKTNLPRINKHIQDHPLTPDDLALLLGYRGSLMPQRIRQLWRAILIMQFLDIPSFTQGKKLIEDYPKLFLVYELPMKATSWSLYTFSSRLWDNPSITDRVDGLRVYLWEIFRNAESPCYRIPMRLQRTISTRSPTMILENIYSLIPKGLPEQIRDEVYQYAIVDGMESGIILDYPIKRIRKLIGRVFKESGWKYGPLSLDASPPWDDYGRSLIETLAGTGF